MSGDGSGFVAIGIPRSARDFRQNFSVSVEKSYNVALFTTAASARLRSNSPWMEFATLM